MSDTNLSIAELKKITQESVLYRTNLPIRLFHKRISIYLTRLLIHTPVTPNQITMAALTLELVGAAIFSWQQYLWGAIAYHVAVVLDNTDGEVARYKRACTTEGIYLDIISHYITYPAIFIGLSVGIFRALGDPWALLMGSIASVGVVLVRVSKDIKYTTIAEAMIRKEERALQMQGDAIPEPGNGFMVRSLSVLHFIARYGYQHFTIFSLIILIWAVSTVMSVDVNVPLRYMLYFYGLTFPLICLILFFKVMYNKETRGVIGSIVSGVYDKYPRS